MSYIRIEPVASVPLKSIHDLVRERLKISEQQKAASALASSLIVQLSELDNQIVKTLQQRKLHAMAVTIYNPDPVTVFIELPCPPMHESLSIQPIVHEDEPYIPTAKCPVVMPTPLCPNVPAPDEVAIGFDPYVPQPAGFEQAEPGNQDIPF